jgi:hypothetical protein
MTESLQSKNNGVFCMLNCFDNYSIVAGKVIEFYIQNASKYFFKDAVQTMSYFEHTPYMFYSLNLLAQQSPDNNRSKQYTDYITILGLTSVTLARIFDSRAVVYPHQGVTPQAGFSTMYAYANVMNKLTVYWTDDLRNLWGTSDDPLMIGMAPLPYKYLWTASTRAGQDISMNQQSKGMNANIQPNIGSESDLCPRVNEEEFSTKWNTFFQAFSMAQKTTDQNSPGMNKRMTNLVILGRLIIDYVENGKINLPSYEVNKSLWGTGGWNPALNFTLFFDMEYIITDHINLLYSEEQLFIKANKDKIITNTQHKTPPIQPDALSSLKKKNLLSTSMMKGFQLMNQPENKYEYFSYF